MRSIVIALCLFATDASAQTYNVTSTGKIIDKNNCYSFQIPAGWKVASENPVPLLIRLPPKARPVPLQNLPKGFASLSLVPGVESSEKPESIDQWIQLRRRAHPFSLTREVLYPPATGITRAVELRWIEESIEPGEQTVAMFFVFRGRPFAAYLTFYVKDRRRRQYPMALAEVLNSFRPLTDFTAGSTGC